MLCISRKVGESVVIDEDIVVKIASVRGSRVRLAIEAPLKKRIERQDLSNNDVKGGERCSQ